MHHRITKLLFAVLALALMGACATKHSSRAILYESPTGSSVFSLVKTKPTYSGDVVSGKLASGNPIYLPKNAVFDLDINELRPGWIHLRRNPELIVKDDMMSSETTGTAQAPQSMMVGPTEFVMPDADNEWSSTQEKFLLGRELWLIAEITQVKSSDPLELSSGKFASASNVKMDMFSYGSVPLSVEDRRIFHLDQTSSYRIVFKVYEVKGMKFKQSLARIYNNPGLFGLASATVDTIKEVFTTIIGPTLFNTDSNGTLLIEKALLESDGTLEFKGTVNILRTNADFDVNKTEFLLYDPVKSDLGREDKCVTTFKNHESYKAALKQFVDKCKDVDLSSAESEKYSYLRFSLTKWAVK